MVTFEKSCWAKAAVAARETATAIEASFMRSNPPAGILMNLSTDLQAAIADARARVRFDYPRWLRPLLARDVIGITLGRHIYLSPRVLERPPAEVERLVRHELAHVRQV